MKSEYRLIVFDWDGTLADSETQILNAMHAAVADTQLPARTDDEVRNIIGLGLQEAIDALFPDADTGQHEQIRERYRYHFIAQDRGVVHLFPGAEALLQSLNDQEYFLAIATGKGRNGLDRVLAQSGLAELFHASRCADECFSKPHPQMLLELMEFTGVSPRETLMIGDTEYDMLMAANAGVDAIAVSYGVHETERLLRCKPAGIVHSLAEIHAWLSK